MDDNYIGPLVMGCQRTFVPKGWGCEDWIWNSNRYCGKVLFVNRGKKCSWHYHKVKDETFLVVEGVIALRYSRDTSPPFTACVAEDYGLASEIILRPGDSFHIPVGCRHQFYGVKSSKIIEFSTHHDDNDSIRLLQGD